ncbi:MAG: D-aminoacyl-tRNA deacylase [Gemmatimonadota bacterium]|nr:D-aminoacyl-tRNA deacylase [Gemmatimonadota bacterium]
MRAVIQRVTEARVVVEGRVVGEIGRGLLVLVGFGGEDEGTGERGPEWLANKLWGLRVFADEKERMNRSTRDAGGSLLIVSQFTLYGDVSRGMRPFFGEAAPPDEAERLYDRLVEVCRRGGPVETGEFGAMMQVESVNDGPVTIVVER